MPKQWIVILSAAKNLSMLQILHYVQDNGMDPPVFKSASDVPE